jgi:hypothetical protein
MQDPADPAAPAQDDTVPDTTTTDTDAANLADETTAADANLNANRSEDFRCEFFLREVRDDMGALRAQYRDDELIVQRFEQCISADVLADTIPDRRLPFTGGSPFSLLAAGALLVAGLLAGKWVIRRR